MIIMDAKESTGHAKIIVFGVGGGGGNAVDNMVRKGDLEGVTFIAANTDMQALEHSRADQKLQIGARLTAGLGAGADPEVGKNAALEDQMRLAEILEDVDMVFITAGMGGGTGTGAAPVIARIAKESGALTVGVVTKPFQLEGTRRQRNADSGISELENNVDSLIVIPNDNLIANSTENTTMTEAFTMADDVLYGAVKSISSLVTQTGYINVDFADVRRIMKSRGRALMSTGEGGGEGRTTQAAQMAITSRLLEENSIRGANGILVNIIGGRDFRISEMEEAMSMIRREAHESAEIIMGLCLQDNMTDRVRLTVIATGFDRSYEPELRLDSKAGQGMRKPMMDMKKPDERAMPIKDTPKVAFQTSEMQPPPIRGVRQPSFENPFIDKSFDQGKVEPAYIRKQKI